MDKILLTISLLASDREDTLRLCLESVKPLLEKVPSELIVVQTTENQKIRNILEKYTSHIIRFQWCDDFSAARNAGLREAKGEWFLYLDDDEWFEDVTEICEFFLNGEYKNYNSAQYLQRNYEDFGKDTYTDSRVGRMARIQNDTEFIYPIHEVICNVYTPVKYFNAFVHHYGYVRQNGIGQQKARRNLVLLERELKKNSSDMRLAMQILQEYQVLNMYDEAEKLIKTKLELFSKEHNSGDSLYWIYFMSAAPNIWIARDDLKGAFEIAERFLQKNPPYELARLALYMILITVSNEQEQWEKAVQFFYEYERLWKRCQADRKKIELQQIGVLTLDCIEREMGKVYTKAAYCALKTGKKKEAVEILKLMPWEKQEKDSIMILAAEANKQAMPELLECYARIDCRHPYLYLQKALYAEKTGNREEAEYWWTQAWNEKLPEYKEQLFCFALRNQYSVKEIVQQTDLEEWCRIWENHMKEYKENIPDILEQIKDMGDTYSLFYLALRRQWCRECLTEKKTGIKISWEEFCKYLTCGMTYYEEMFCPELWNGVKPYAMPREYQFLWLMKKAQGEEGVKQIRKMREAASVFPLMRGVVENLAEQERLKENNKREKEKQEFLKLAEAVKCQVKEMMEHGKYMEAKEVLDRLEILLPGDVQIREWKKALMNETVG